jgi:L-threonylcarbamoyladenylate synthase
MEYIKISSGILEKDVISKAKMVLKNGGIIALPTETVYGLVGDFFSEEAVRKIYEIKGRDFSKPLTVFVPDMQSVALYVEKIPNFAYKLMRAFCPGPLTVVLKKKAGLDIPLKTDTLGFRIPDHQAVIGLLKEYGPLVSTSANLSGGKDALSAQEVREYFDGEIGLILDGGKTILQIPSTVIDCTGHSPKIIREGKIKKEDIERIVNT